MNIHALHFLYLLIFVPLLAWFILRSGKASSKRLQRYAEPEFFQIYLGKLSPFYRGLKLFLQLLAFVLVIIAMIRPQWDFREQELQSRGMDIVFAIDVSRSMDATDIQPNRLTRSILQVSAFVDQLDTDRVGIISFAGAPTLECPLTDDYEAVRMVLSSLSSDSAARYGTDIGRALDMARISFNAGSGGGVLILISDGEDIPGNAVAKARDLASDGVRIYTMGVGSQQGAIITNPYTGAEHVSRLDAATLERIATISGGEFFHITPSASEIQIVLAQIYRNEKEHTRTRKTFLYREQYHIFAIAALILLTLESLISSYRRQERRVK